MKCPVDGATLVIAERSGVEIDYCPQCRGVWLDRGELDKIVARSGEAVRAVGRGHDGDGYREAGGSRKKKSKLDFIGDIFDF